MRVRDTVRRADPADAEWMSGFLRERWSVTTIAVHGETIDAVTLPALLAGVRQGLATYRLLGDDAELITLDAVPRCCARDAPAGARTGAALIEA
jgi:hypothetical protein